MDWTEKMQFLAAAKSGNSSYLDSDLARFDYSNKDIIFKAIELAACHGHHGIVSTLSQVVREYSAKSRPGLLRIDTSFPLHSAACMGHSDILAMLLNTELFPISFELYSTDGLTALHLAAHSGCTSESLERMLQRFPKMDVNSRSWREEFTALHMAADSGRLQVIRFLLQSLQPDFDQPWRVDPMAKDCMGRTALHYAAREGRADVVQELLDCQADVGLQDGDHDGLTPLHMAARSGHVNVIRILMTLGPPAAVNSRAKHSLKLKSYFDEEFQNLRSYNGFHFPRPRLIDSLFWMTGGFTPLHFAARYGHLEAVRELFMLTESSLNLAAAKDSAGFSPYDWAKLHNQESMFLQIVEEQATRDGLVLHHRLIVDRIVGDDDMPPGMKSLKLKVARSDFIQENKDMEMLIHPWEIPHSFFHEPSEGCGVIPSNGRRFLLHMAAGGGDMARLKWLLAHDIEINEVDEEGFTALERALQGQHFKCAYELILHPEISLNQRVDTIVIQEVKNQHGYGLAGKSNLTEFMLAFLIRANIENASRLLDLLRCAQENGMDEVARAIIERPELKRKIYEDRQVYLDCSNAILVGAALIAGLAYQGLLQPPLGYSYNYHGINYAGVEENEGVRYFWWFNSFAFFLSVATVIAGATGAMPVVDEANILKSVEKVKRAMALASVLLGMAVVCVVGAYSAAGFGILPPLRPSLNIIRPSVICGATACVLIILWFCKRLSPLLLELLIRPITLDHLVQKVKASLDSIDEPINLTQDFVDGTISYCVVYTKYFLLYILICIAHTLRIVGSPNGSQRLLRYAKNHVGIIFNV